MARSLKEISTDIETFDEDYDYGSSFTLDAWKEGRKPLIDELEAWHQLPLEDRN